MKKTKIFLSAILMVTMLFPTTAFAQTDEKLSLNEIKDEEVIFCETTEYNAPLRSAERSLDSAPSFEDFSNNDEIIDYITSGAKAFSAGTEVLSIDELLANSQIMSVAANGDVTGTFTSKRMDTGTPGITWDYTVDYTISPMPSGIGWYFKSVSVTVAAYKGWTFYTWASIGVLSFTKATYSLSPTTRPTSLTVNITLKFEIWTDATGSSPITYSEDHSHTTSVSNVYN